MIGSCWVREFLVLQTQFDHLTPYMMHCVCGLCVRTRDDVGKVRDTSQLLCGNWAEFLNPFRWLISHTGNVRIKMTYDTSLLITLITPLTPYINPPCTWVWHKTFLFLWTSLFFFLLPSLLFKQRYVRVSSFLFYAGGVKKKWRVMSIIRMTKENIFHMPSYEIINGCPISSSSPSLFFSSTTKTIRVEGAIISHLFFLFPTFFDISTYTHTYIHSHAAPWTFCGNHSP